MKNVPTLTEDEQAELSNLEAELASMITYKNQALDAAKSEYDAKIDEINKKYS